jgi:signal transduction histidine kinase
MLRRTYERVGTRYVRVFPLLAFGIALPLAAALVAVGAPFLGASAAELAGLLAADALAFVIAAALAVRRWRPVSARLVRWMETERRDPAEAGELWHVVVRLPYQMPLRSFVDGLALTAGLGGAYLALVVDLSATETAIACGGLVAAGLNVTLALYLGLELYLRPVIRDLGTAMPAAVHVTRARVPFAHKMFAALLLVGDSAGLNLAWVLSLDDPSLEAFAAAMGLAVAVTLTFTLAYTILFTGALGAPVWDLVGATRRVREGDLGARVPPISDDELGVLAGSFNLMAEELARSREALVAAREEERRRLRRDLHDELGPTLASVAMRLEAAGEMIDRDPRQAQAMLSGLRDEVANAVAEIRRVVYELRPPQLDELGLVGAIEERAARLAEHDGARLRVRIEAPAELAPLPAGVEVAAYRIVQEALSNAARHSGGSACTVRLGADGALDLEVRDDGMGVDEERRSGVGLASMRERAAELGGTCTVERAAGGGTVVRARLPLPRA